MWTDRYTPRCVADSAWSREKRQGLTQIVRGLCDGSESPHITLLHGPTGCGKLTTLRALLQQELAQANPSHTPHSATAVAETTRATKTAAHGGAAPSQIDCRVEYVDPSSSTQNSCVSHNHVSESDNDLITVVHTCDITLASYKQVLQNTLLLCSGAAATHSQLQLHASQRSDDASWTPTASLSLSSMQTQSNGRPDAAVQANAIAKATDQARVRALVIKFYGELASDSVQACTRDFVMEYESYTHSAAAAAGAHLVAHHDETTCRDVGSRRNSQETDKDRVAWRRAERNTSSSRDCAHTPTRALHRYLIFFIHTTHDTHSSRVHLRSCFGAHVVTSPAVKLFACTPVTALNLRRRLLTILHAESVQRQQQQQQQQDERHSHGSGDGLYQDSWSSQAQTVIQRSNSCSSSGNSSSNDVVELHTSRSFSATAATAAAVSTAAVSQCGQQSGTSRGRDGGAPHTHRCVGVAVDGKKNTKVCHSTSGTCKVEDDFTSMMLRHKRRRAQAPQQHDAMSGGKNWGQRGVTVGIAPLSSRPLPLLTPDALDTIVNTSQGDVRQAILQAQWTALIPPGVPPLAAPTAAMARSRSGERAHERRNDAASCSVLSCSPPDTRSHRRRHRSVSAPASSSTPTVLDILTDMAEESDVAAMTAGSGTQWVKTSHNMGCESCGDVARQNDSMVHRSRATTSTTKKNNSSTMNHYRVDRTFRNMIDNSYPNHHVDDTNDANNSHEDHTKDDASSDATCDLSHGRAAQSVAAVRDEYLDLSHATARLLCQRYTLGSVLATLNVAPHRLLDYLVNNLPYYFHENQVTGYALCVRAASMADTRRVSDYALLPSSNNSSADRSISRGIGESNLSYGDVPGTVGWCDGHLPHGVGCAARPPAYHPLPSAGGGLSLDVMALHLFDASYRCFHPRHAHRLARGFMPQRPPPYTPDAYPRGRGFGRDAMHVVEGTSCSSSSSSWYTGAGRPAGDACDDSSDGGGGSVCRSTVEWERVWMRRLGVRGGKEAYGRGEGGGIDAATRGGGAGRARGMREQGMSDNGEQVHKEEEKAMRSWPGGSGWGVLQRRCVGGDRRRVWANRATYGMWSANGHAGEEEEEAVSSALVKAARSASPGLVHGNVWTNRHGGVIWTNEEDKGEHALGEKSAGVKCSGRCAQSVSASVSPGIRSSEYDMLREGLPSVMERCGAREAVLDYFWFAQRIVLECEADEDGGGGGGGAAVDGPEESTRGEEMGRGRAPLVQRRTVFSLAGAGKSNSSSSTTALTSRTDTRTRPVEERVDRSWSGHVPPGCGPPRRTTFVLRRSPTPMPPTQSAHSASLPTRRAVTALQYAILRCGLPASVSLRRDRFVVVGMDDGEEEGGGGDGWNDGWQGRATPAAVVEDLSCRPLMPPGEDIEEFSD